MTWPPQNSLEYGRVYKAIERALWAFAPVPALLLLLSYPLIQTARQLEADLATDIAAENAEYCGKWGMPAGTDRYPICVEDLVEIRAHAQQRLRDLNGSGFGF
jgi:hypothetical protein